MFMRGPARNSTSGAPSHHQSDFEFVPCKKLTAEPKQLASNQKASVSNSEPFVEEDDASIFELDRLIQLFAMCDQDNDDYVTRADFVRVSHEIGGLPPLLVAQLDRVLPPQQPGLRVSLHELVTMARNFLNNPTTATTTTTTQSPIKFMKQRCNEPTSEPHHHHQFATGDSNKFGSSTSTPSSPAFPPQQKAENMPEMYNHQSVIVRLQREKESLEAKLGGMMQIHRQYGGGCEDQIANLQGLIAKYHQQISVAVELHQQQQQQQKRTPPPVAPKPPPRRSLPIIQQSMSQSQILPPTQPQHQFQQSQSASRLVHHQPQNPQPTNFGLEQIDELSQQESGDDQRQKNSSDSSSSSSDGEGEMPQQRRHRHHHSHHHHHRSSKHPRQTKSSRQVPPPPPPQAKPQQSEPLQPEFNIDIEAVDSAFQQQEQLIGHLKQQLMTCMSDRERYKKLAQDFYRRIQFQKTGTDPVCSPATPMMESQLPSTPSTSSRLAEVRQLPRMASASPMLPAGEQVTAADLSLNNGILSTPVAEHLVEETEHAAVIQELVQSLAASGCRIPPEKLQEFAAELECRSSKADRLRAAADLLAASLSKQRQHSANLASALARSEENQSALRMALDCATQKAEAMQALLKLSESEQMLLLAHCRAAGVISCSDSDQSVPCEQDPALLISQAVSARRQAESEAHRVLSRLDLSCGILGHSSGTSSAVGGELGCLSSNNSNASPRATGTCSSTGTTSSRTTDPASQPEEGSTVSTSSAWTSMDEQRLREYVAQLDRDVQAMQMTLNDPVLESAAVAAVGSSGTVQSTNHLINASLLDSPLPLSSVGTNGSGSTKDSLFGCSAQLQHIETAVLVQELAQLKEQRAESKTQCFILEREKRALETELRAREQQATVLKVQLDQAKLELEEATLKVKKLEDVIAQQGLNAESLRSGATNSQVQAELEQALVREKRLRARIQELVDTMEMVGRSAEKQQLCGDGGVDLVSELRQANSTLSESYERARKKQEQRIKRLESQLNAVTSRYETKVALLKKQVSLLEETSIGQALDSHTFAPEAHL